MAKRVLMIAPFEALRGNVSGRQKLQYAENNNPAYEAPEGINYARNYKPRYVVSKNSKTGLVHFSVRTKHAAVNNTATNRVQGALAAARAAYYVAIKDLSVVGKLMSLYGVSAAKANGESMYKWFVDTAIMCYRQVLPSFSFAGKVGSTNVQVTLDNIFRDGVAGTPCPLPDEIMVKFWSALSYQGRMFEIAGQEGIFFNGMMFDQLIESNLNVLGLETAGSEGQYIKLGDNWVQTLDKTDPAAEPEYVEAGDLINAKGGDIVYMLTDVDPEA